MRIALAGPDGPLRRAIAQAAERKGWTLAGEGQPAACAICLSAEQVEAALATPGLERLVQRSTAYVYGSSDKNPGMMTEERVSLLDPRAPEQKWLRAEARALAFPNAAVLRLANLLAPEEGDYVVRQLAGQIGFARPGRDPNLQFLTLEDAARAFLAAAESRATGVFNIAGGGAIPLKKAYRAAGTERIALPGGAARLAVEYNWTVSGERAARELGFTPECSSVEALRRFLVAKRGARPELLADRYDDFGLDIGYIHAWSGWFRLLRRAYWRIDAEGYEHLPRQGRAMFVSNHRGFMPLDAVMHLYLTYWNTGRIIRFLIIPALLRMPFLSNFLTKLGGVIANQVNAQLLFEREELVGIFPEGIRGAFSPYRRWHQLRDFSKSAFAKLAIEFQTPVIPCAVVGHTEIFPIIGRVDSSWISKTYGWPYLPIAPMFPLAPVPLPVKWHVRMLAPVPLEGLKPADAENARLVREFARHVQHIVQRNVDDMRLKRKSWFWGRVLDGTAPPAEPFAVPLRSTAS